MSHRHAYLLAYDIAEPARWRKIHELAQGHGARLQYSVFRCELDQTEFQRLRNRIVEEIHHREDRVMLIDLGPLDGQEAKRITCLGSATLPPPSGPAIL